MRPFVRLAAVSFRPHKQKLDLILALLSCSLIAQALPLNLNLCDVGSPCQILDQSTTGPLQYNLTNSVGTLSLYADNTGGILNALASYSLNAPSTVAGQLTSNAQWFDSLTTLSKKNPGGTQAYLSLTFDVTGSLHGPATGNLVAGQLGEGLPFPESVDLFGDKSVTFKPIPIVLGPDGTFNILYALNASVYYGPGNPLSAASDFSQTAVLTGLGVFLDAEGTIPVSDAVFISGSGVQYTANGIVPEPGSLLLLGSGIGLLAVIRRYRNTRTLRSAGGSSCKLDRSN